MSTLANPHPTILLSDYAPTPYSIDTVSLDIEIAPGVVKIVSVMRITPRAETPVDTPLVLHGEDIELASIALDGAPLALDQYETDASGLTLHTPPHRTFALETEVVLAPEDNKNLMGLYRSNDVWCTQCEAEGFRRITYFYDRPDVLSTYRVKLTAPKDIAPVLLANGNLVERGDLADGGHFAVWDDPHPKPSYLFAIVAGDLGRITDNFKTRSGRAVELAIYCERGKEEQCHYAMDSLKRSMKWDEERFGLEYDLDVFNIVAVSDFNFGAMENKGLNIFNDRYVLAHPDTATDADYANIERVIAHEYFHNWTGNRVTCRDWFQLCLKEGLTVYRDQEFTADERSRAVKRIEDVKGLRISQFPEDGGPLAHPARPESYREINNFYTATVYEKGAEIVRMLATLLGGENFRKGLDLYFERHDGDATTIEAWISAFETATGRDLSQFCKWYTQAGTPDVAVSETWDETAKRLSLTFTQSTKPTPGQPIKEAMVVPIKFGLLNANGDEMNWQSTSENLIGDELIVLDNAETTVNFDGLTSRPAVSLLREFSAPVKLGRAQSADERLFLARHDTDPFNRWQALQDVALEYLVTQGQSHDGADTRTFVSDLSTALRDTLDATDLDDAFKAQALILPTEGDIAQAIGENIDPAMIHRARNSLITALSAQLKPSLERAYDKLVTLCSPYSIAARATAARALRNRCLGLLVSGGDRAARQTAHQHYQNADNMTDRLAALGALIANWNDDCVDLLDDFRTQHASDPLVFDKWLSLTASAADDRSCLERIEAIYAAPTFPRANPNRLHALIGAFSMGNPTQFAKPDGSGFAFVTRICREVDGRNPQVAARILVSFRSWRKYEPSRRAFAKSALDSLSVGGPLSRDVTDILERTLAG